MINPIDHIDANVPEDIRDFSVWFCKTYQINGICDPMWVCNVISMYLGRGDGHGNFGDGLYDPFVDSDFGRSLVNREGESDRYYAAYRRLYNAFTTCIIESDQDHMPVYHELAKLRAV